MGGKVNGAQFNRRNPSDREQRVLKDVGLRDWWDRTGMPLRKFCQDNREQIDEQIDRADRLAAK